MSVRPGRAFVASVAPRCYQNQLQLFSNGSLPKLQECWAARVLLVASVTLVALVASIILVISITRVTSITQITSITRVASIA